MKSSSRSFQKRHSQDTGESGETGGQGLQLPEDFRGFGLQMNIVSVRGPFVSFLGFLYRVVEWDGFDKIIDYATIDG